LWDKITVFLGEKKLSKRKKAGENFEAEIAESECPNYNFLALKNKNQLKFGLLGQNKTYRREPI